jgi:outer membrane protein assembly factor BamB
MSLSPAESASPVLAESGLASTPIPEVLPARSLRLWPAVLLVVVGIGLFFAAPRLIEGMQGFMLGGFAPLVCGVLLLVWWLLASRAPWRVKLYGLGLGVILGGLSILIADWSLRFYLILWGLSATAGVLVLFWAVSRGLARRPRAIGGVTCVIVALLPWLVLRSDGAQGEGMPDFNWRWASRPEERARAYFAEHGNTGGRASAIALQPGDWPGFRGPNRDSAVPDVHLVAWDRKSPRKLWDHPVFPGWSSFCMVGDYLFTQEQRDEEETLVCYRAADGQEVWTHREKARFQEQMGGPGPRATPTFHDGKLYAFGATGLLLCVRPETGERLWATNVTEDLGATGPVFGIATSPVVWKDAVIVSPGARERPRLAAYHRETGSRLWVAGTGTEGYSSPQMTTLEDIPQVLMFTIDGLFSHDPKTGKELWKYEWPTGMVFKVTQPQVLPDGRIILAVGDRYGTRCIKVSRSGETWQVKEVWASSRFKPRFNDFVCHNNHLYGLDDGGILACIDLQNGKRRWKDGRYGYGQVLLVGDHLIVLSDEGKIALVAASPDGYQELGQMQGIEGKTWNHPVLVRGKLFIRNGEQAACYELATVEGK